MSHIVLEYPSQSQPICKKKVPTCFFFFFKFENIYPPFNFPEVNLSQTFPVATETDQTKGLLKSRQILHARFTDMIVIKHPLLLYFLDELFFKNEIL